MNERAVFVLAGLAGAFALLHGRAVAAGDVYGADQVRALAAPAAGRFDFPTVDMLTAIAFVESSFNPAAYRYEPHLGDASVGLMQTLTSTARWLYEDMGYRDHGEPTLESLARSPQQSLYFGAAYLDWLSRWKGRRRSEEWIIRAYNGGPGGATSAATAPYWSKYQAARRRFG
ncbi:transglycosylase SLT domain-containing protein [Algihabitans albus]|uniref:transglycosylase SLT domain-containing protein n=1 Tax=Algihabitans albus TaxID=2164067 RepID=UPI0035CEA782